jgi:hypothetical protein
MSINSEIDAALRELVDANDQLASAEVKLNDARRNQCSAINRVNEAQKKIDVIVLYLKQGAYRDTDWSRKSKAWGACTE